MIEIFFAPTPNCWKITIMLEECSLAYKLTPVFPDRGDLQKEGFLAVSPNGRIPAMLDHSPTGGGPPVAMFESGAILLYLAEKTGRFLPSDLRKRYSAIQWTMWQMAGLGPMLGQHGHFFLYATDKIPYAITRFRNEATRLYQVLDHRLEETGAYLAGNEYTIADIACFPWIMTHKAQSFSLDDFPNAKMWFADLRGRDEVQSGLAAGQNMFAAELARIKEG